MELPSANWNSDKRKTMCFYLPLETDISDSGNEIYVNNSTESLSDQFSNQKNNYKKDSVKKYIIKNLYLNPQSINATYRKIQNRQQTKGGFVIQYWGEDLVTLAINGITGAAGMSEINKLLSIYRHDQIHYQQIIEQRRKRFVATIESSAGNILDGLNDGNTVDPVDTAISIGNYLTGGEVSNIINGVNTVMDFFSETGESGVSVNPRNSDSFTRGTTLSSLFTSITMEFQGIYYRGYIDSFSYSENSSEPGHFNYSFNFTVLYQSGKRNNFMPWHKEAEDRLTGESLQSTLPIVDAEKYMPDTYTWPFKSPSASVNILTRFEGALESLDESLKDFENFSQKFRNNNLDS